MAEVDSAVECLRIYFSLGEIVIRLAEYTWFDHSS